MSAPRTSLLTKLFRRTPKTIRNTKPSNRARLDLGVLEGREMPAYVSGSSLIIQGTNAADTVTVSQTTPANWWEVSKIQVVQNGVTQTFSAGYLQNLYFYGNGGNDNFQDTAYLYVYADGGSGADVLRGGPMDDTLIGGTNNDVLYGGDGNDNLSGGQGDDVLYGASGIDGYENGSCNDVLQGGDGADHLYGGYGSDTLIGGNDSDWIQGQWGDDVIEGANWDFTTNTPDPHEIATYAGSTTNDQLFGENGNDTIYGGDGADSMSGGFDSDVMYGDDGNDAMWGAFSNSTSERPNSTNNDTLYGGEGNDQLFGGDGNDWLWGEGGNDVLYGQNDSDALDGGTGDDQLYGDGTGTVRPGNDNLVGGAGQDWLYGGGGSDNLYGAGYQNVYSYQDGSNYLYGEAGDDNLYGADGYDYMDGGTGDDGLFGGYGYNILTGGGDDDRFLVGVGSDSVQDAGDRDAVLYFRAGDEQWGESEVVKVDAGLNWLHHATNNTSLLKQSDGEPIAIQRVTNLPGAGDGVITFGDNTDGFIRITDGTFTNGYADQVIVHEMGHNWDNENANWDGFKSLSNWQESAVGDDVPDGFTRAADLAGNPQPWIYDSSAQFSRLDGYGRTNPYEDFATCLETYYSGSNPSENWQDKWNFIHDFIASKTD